MPWPTDRHGAGPVAEAVCGGCHGSASPLYPRLAGQDRLYLVKQLHDYASGARSNEVMSPIARDIPAKDRAAVADYYAGLSAAARERVEGSTGDGGALGAGLAVSGDTGRGLSACGSCHSATDVDRPPASPVLDGMDADYLALQLRLWKAGERRNDPLGRMRSIAGLLTEEEIVAVSRYYESRGGR